MRALVLSGGGEKGGYQAGVCDYLINDLKRSYDVLCGVSVGAINCAFLAQDLDADNLIDLWWDIETKDVMRHHKPFSYLTGYFRGSLYRTHALRKLIEAHFDPDAVRLAKRKLRVGAVSLTTGEYEVFTEQDPDIIDGIMASAAHPVAMDTIRARDQWWSDGGVRNVTPLKSAITAGATDIDVVIVSTGKGPGRWNKEEPSLLDRSLRELSIVLDEAQDNDLKTCEWVNAAVRSGAPEAHGKREVNLTIIRPETPLDSDTLEFNPDKTRKMIQRGKDDARRVTSGVLVV
jgi:NTE family protein